MPVSGLGRGSRWWAGLSSAWLEPEGQVVLPDWLTQADHTYNGYILWSLRRRLSSLSTTLPSGAWPCSLCAVSPWEMYSLCPVTLDWRLLKAYFVDGNWINKLYQDQLLFFSLLPTWFWPIFINVLLKSRQYLGRLKMPLKTKWLILVKTQCPKLDFFILCFDS